MNIDDILDTILEIMDLLVHIVTNFFLALAWIIAVILLVFTFPIWIVPFLIRRASRKR